MQHCPLGKGLPKVLNALSILLVLLAATSHSSRIPCEFNSQTWKPNNNYVLNDREMLVSTRYGFDMIIDRLDRTVSQAILEKGTWDPTQLHLIARLLSPGMKVLNLGPQTGLQAILIGKLIGPSGQLIILEPNPISFAIVKKNIYLNNLQDVALVLEVGAGDVQSDQRMVSFSQNTGGAEISPMSSFRGDLSMRQFEEWVVKVDLVDNIVGSELQMNLVLMDVEKMEVEALLGMKKLIQRSRDILLLVEWQYAVNPRRKEEKAIRCLSWLGELGFQFYKYRPNDKNKCEEGTFQRIQPVMSLLQMGPVDIVIAPHHIDLHSMK